MTFRPSGASRSYPAEEDLESEDMISNNTNIHAVVYSAVYGGYDPIKHPVRQTVPTEFWMFTDSAAALETPKQDDASDELHAWIIVETPPPQPSPRMAAKWFKVFPEQVCIRDGKEKERKGGREGGLRKRERERSSERELV
jgi:hypothetical protein